jgi:ADP-heptose:LPS heptosyltransferase
MGQILKEKYDVCIVFRAVYSPYAEQFSIISRAKMRIGVKNPSGKDRFTYHVIPSLSMHEVEFCFECLKPLEVKYKGERLFFFIEEEVIKKFANLKIEVLCHISSRKRQNRMSLKKWKEVFKRFEKDGIKVFFTADPRDSYLANKLAEETKATFVKTKNILELAGVIKNAKVFVGLDGGAIHLGAALGIKTIALFGSTPLERWYPWGYKELTIKSLLIKQKIFLKKKL